MLGKSFNQRKEQNQPKVEAKPSRVRLACLNTIPTLQHIRLLLSEAEKNRGLLCEMPMRTPLGSFLLSCQSDSPSAEPCWTLYEGEEGAKQAWSYSNPDLEMVSDIVSMSVINKNSSTELKLPGLQPHSPPAAVESPLAAAPAAEPLPATNQPYEPGGNWQAPNLASQQWPQSTADPQAQQWTEAAPDPNGAWNPAASQAPPNWNQPSPDPSSAWNPYQQPTGGYETSGFGAHPQEGWAAPNQPYIQPQPGSYGSDPHQMMQSALPYANHPQQYGTAPSDSPWIGGTQNTSASPGTSLAAFALVLESRSNITLAELSMDPALPSACLNSVLKLQEMVLTGHFNEHVAIEALKLSLANNGILDDTIFTKAKGKGSISSDELLEQAINLLQNAGIVSEKDVAKAQSGIAKHKNLAEALLAARVVDQLVLDAALEGQSFVANGRLREDKAMVALHYCVRSRTTFKDALTELSIDIL